MATVPTYQSQVREAAAPNIRVNTGAQPIEAFGGGREKVTEALQQTVSLVDRERQKADQLAVLEADTKIAQAKNDLIYNPETGLMTRKGKDAFGAYDEFKGKFDTTAAEIEKGLSNPAQKQAFRERLMAHSTEFNNQSQRHVFQESQAFDDEVTTSRLAVAQDEAVLNYADPNILARNKYEQQKTILEYADRKGLPPEWVKNKMGDTISKTNSAVVDRMLANGNDLAAQKYYAENKDQFSGNDVVRVEKSLEEGSLRGESQRRTDVIMSQGKSMTAALEEVKKIEDPKVRDATQQRVREEYQLQKIAKEDLQTKQFNTAANIIEQNKGDRDAIPPRLWNNLELSQRNAIDARSKQLREGLQPTTDWTTYGDLKQIAMADETKNEFLRTDITQYRAKLADQEYKEMINLQAQLRKGDQSGLDGLRTKTQVVEGTLKAAGFNPNSKNEAERQKIELFRRSVDTEVAQMKASGKHVGTEEIQSITDNLLVKGKVPGSGILWDDTKSAFELQSGQKLVVDVEDIPRGERIKIEAALRKKKIPVTEANISLTYNSKLATKPRPQ